MSSFDQLVRFVAEDGNTYYADLGPNANGPPSAGVQLQGFGTLEALSTKTGNRKATVARVRFRSTAAAMY
jgi:hypothetical protein